MDETALYDSSLVPFTTKEKRHGHYVRRRFSPIVHRLSRCSLSQNSQQTRRCPLGPTWVPTTQLFTSVPNKPLETQNWRALTGHMSNLARRYWMG